MPGAGIAEIGPSMKDCVNDAFLLHKDKLMDLILKAVEMETKQNMKAVYEEIDGIISDARYVYIDEHANDAEEITQRKSMVSFFRKGIGA